MSTPMPDTTKHLDPLFSATAELIELEFASSSPSPSIEDGKKRALRWLDSRNSTPKVKSMMLLSARNQFNDERPRRAFSSPSQQLSSYGAKTRGENCCIAKSSIDANSPALRCDSLRSPFNSAATAPKRRC